MFNMHGRSEVRMGAYIKVCQLRDTPIGLYEQPIRRLVIRCLTYSKLVRKFSILELNLKMKYKENKASRRAQPLSHNRRSENYEYPTAPSVGC